MLHTIIFIGRSGCGKGTQADLLKDRIAKFDKEGRQILYIETGDYYRDFVRGKSLSAKLANDIYEKDELAPEFLGCWLWSDILIEQIEDNMHLVFDGTSRSLLEAQVLTSALKFYKRQKPIVIYINVSNKWSEEKLLARGRHDDSALSKINKRLQWFDEEVIPAIDYFKNEKFYRVIEVNGEQSIEKVHADIIDVYDDET